MGKLAPDSEASSVEELDGEPSIDRRTLQRREVLLGLCLLVIVLGVAGWIWRGDETRNTAYRAGVQAAAAHHWDEARTQFLAAGSYPDAKDRATQAAIQIAERDKQYKLALTALANYDGIAALHALDALDKIEPDYGGTAMLRSGANTQLYRSALEGVVAQRSTARPPGLYYRTEGDWVWLEGSDSASAIHNYGNGEYIIYDVPETEGGATPTVETTTGSLPGRRLMATRFSGDDRSLTPVALNPQTSVFWGTLGGWSFTYGCSGSVPAQLQSYYCADGLVYNAAGSPITTLVHLPGPNWIVLDLARDGSKMLVADIETATGGIPTFQLYLAGPDGSDPRLLNGGAGAIGRAAFSQDGRYALATLSFPDPLGTSYTAELVDLSGQNPPQTLSTVHAGGPGAAAGLDFVLLTGAGAGKVAIIQYSEGLTTLKLADLSQNPIAAPTLWVKPQFQGPMMVTRMADGGLLLCGQVQRVSTQLDNVDQRNGQCVQTDSAAHETTFDLPMIARYGIGYAWPRQGAIIYPISMPGTGSSGVSILRISAAQAGTAVPAPAVILELPLAVGQGLNVVAGPTLLAYARQGQLHIRTYDGSFDLILEQGIDALYDMRGALTVTMIF